MSQRKRPVSTARGDAPSSSSSINSGDDGKPGSQSSQEIQVNTDISDPVAVAAAMDAAVVSYMTDVKGLKEDHTISNIQLLLGVIAVGLAIYAQFGPIPMPKGRWHLALVVGAYILIQVAFSLMQTYWQKDILFKSKPDKGSHPVIVETHIERYDTAYKVTITKGSKTKTATLQVTDFFDTDGHLYKEDLNSALDKIYI